MKEEMLNRLIIRLNQLRKIDFKDHSRSIKQSDFLLFCGDSSRSLTLKDQAYSPLIDSLRDSIESKGISCTSIAMPWSKLVGNRAYGHPIAINRTYLISRLAKRIPLAFNYNIRPDIYLYEYIIKKARPKAIITIGCSDELCEAARNLNVFHVELLHGIGYSEMKWGWDKKDITQLPQGILSLDSVSTQTFSVLSEKGVLVKEIPHPFLKRFINSDTSLLPKDWKVKKEFPKYSKEILVSLQWGYAPGIDEREEFKGILSNGLFYEELVEAIHHTSDTVLWRFRLHPVQYRNPQKYSKILKFIDSFVRQNPNCEWKESTFLPLPSLLPQCSGHITMSSMCSYEAAYFGVKTLALSPSLKEGGLLEKTFNDLVSAGYLDKQTAKVNSIINWIDRVERAPPLLVNLNENIDTVEWIMSNVPQDIKHNDNLFKE